MKFSVKSALKKVLSVLDCICFLLLFSAFYALLGFSIASLFDLDSFGKIFMSVSGVVIGFWVHLSV